MSLIVLEDSSHFLYENFICFFLSWFHMIHAECSIFFGAWEFEDHKECIGVLNLRIGMKIWVNRYYLLAKNLSQPSKFESSYDIFRSLKSQLLRRSIVKLFILNQIFIDVRKAHFTINCLHIFRKEGFIQNWLICVQSTKRRLIFRGMKLTLAIVIAMTRFIVAADSRL